MRISGLVWVGASMVVVLGGVALGGAHLAPFDPALQVADSLGTPLPPRAGFYLGTDDLGRDVLSRLVVGARLSLLVGVAAMAITISIGSAVGLIAGYYGGLVDLLLMRATDVMLAFPGLLLAVAMVAVLEPGVSTVLVVIGLVSWTGVARVVRAEVLSLRTRDFVLAGHAMGGSGLRIMWRHILPNVAPTVLALAALSTSTTIMLDAGLSFLGIGVPPPLPSWGRMIQEASPYYRTAPWLMIFPGMAVFFSVLAFNLLGHGLIERFRK